MQSVKQLSRGKVALIVAVLVIPVSACDSAKDGAVVTSQTGAGVTGSAEGGGVPAAAAPDSGGSLLDPAVDTDATLLFIREEEKLARDVYLAMADRWGLDVFENIAASEQRHMDAVLGLLDARDLEDPVGSNPAGVFRDEALQSLYDELVYRGLASAGEALLVGADIEDLDIRDLRSAIAATEDSEVRRVLGNLEQGSLNHLRAFSRQLEKNGVAFTPEYMDPEELEIVVAAGGKRGRRGGGS